MSTLFVFPKPRDWNTLEDIVCDVFSRKYHNYNFQRYGRSGQRQSGVDIAGPIETGILGVQCKHHLVDTVKKKDIDTEVSLADGFTPTLSEFIIVTSAERDTEITSYVIQISEDRKKNGKFPVSIKFWDDIYNWITEYPDLLYKHFTKYFPIQELEQLKNFGLDENNKNTSYWPISKDELFSKVTGTIGNLRRIDPYNLHLGVVSFPDVTFSQKVDLELQLSEFFSGEGIAEKNFQEAARHLKAIRELINTSFFSKQLYVFLQARLSLAYLTGWIFRKVTHFDLVLYSGGQVWATSSLPFVASKLIDALPTVLNPESKEAVLVLNISRNISQSVVDYISGWGEKPFAMVSLELEGKAITSAAQALSVSQEISRKIKTLVDSWGIQKIHLFSSMPAALATLVGYHLNAICPLYFYFIDDTRKNYKLGGIITNNL